MDKGKQIPQGITIQCPGCKLTFFYRRLHSLGESAVAAGVTLNTIYTWTNNGMLRTKLRYLGRYRAIRQFIDTKTLDDLLARLFPDRDPMANDKTNHVFHQRRKRSRKALTSIHTSNDDGARVAEPANSSFIAPQSASTSESDDKPT